MALLDAGVLQVPEVELDPQAATAAVASPERWCTVDVLGTPGVGAAQARR